MYPFFGLFGFFSLCRLVLPRKYNLKRWHFSYCTIKKWYFKSKCHIIIKCIGRKQRLVIFSRFTYLKIDCSMVGCIITYVFRLSSAAIISFWLSTDPCNHIDHWGSHFSCVLSSLYTPTTDSIRVTELTRRQLGFRKCKLNTVFQIPHAQVISQGKYQEQLWVKVEILIAVCYSLANLLWYG